MVLVIQTNLFSRSECRHVWVTQDVFTNILYSNSVSSTLFSPAFVLSLHTTLWLDGPFLPSVSFDNSPTGFWNGMFKWAVFYVENSPLILLPSLPPSVLRSGLVLSEDLHLCEECNSTWCSLCLGSDFSQEDTLEIKVFLYTYMISGVLGMY